MGICFIISKRQYIKIYIKNQYIKSDKTLCIIFADLESLIKKMDGCANNPQKSLMTKIGAFIPCGYLTSTIWVFDNIKVSIVYTVENSV